MDKSTLDLQHLDSERFAQNLKSQNFSLNEIVFGM